MVNNIYRIIYHYNDHPEIKFPLHTPEEVEKYQQDPEYKNAVIYAELCPKIPEEEDHTDEEGEDITDIIKEYSGPLNDFYQGKDHRIHVSLLKDQTGRKFIMENEIIRITDTAADEIEFKKGDIIKLEKSSV